MRSSLFVPLLSAVALAAAFAPGCSVNAALEDRSSPYAAGQEPNEGFNADSSQDGGSLRQPEVMKSHSALCVDPSQREQICDPDLPASRQLSEDEGGCGEIGTTSSGGAQGNVGCRMSESGAPKCGVASTGTEGMVCTKGDDCAAGFDCVDGPDGPTCRRYCCSGKCTGHTSQNGGKTFCDIQKLVAFDRNVPVCMPIKACDLLTPGECAANETCAVVTEGGDTGCVAIGEQSAGESCETANCKADLTCIGQAGSRKCYQLCRMGVADACSAGNECKTSALFGGGEFGICKQLPAPASP